MKKHHKQRDTKLMRFLLEEQSVYRFALSVDLGSGTG